MAPLHIRVHLARVCASTHCPYIVLVLEESLSSFSPLPPNHTLFIWKKGNESPSERRGVAESASGGGKVSLGQYVSLGLSLSLSLSGKDFGGKEEEMDRPD